MLFNLWVVAPMELQSHIFGGGVEEWVQQAFKAYTRLGWDPVQ